MRNETFDLESSTPIASQPAFATEIAQGELAVIEMARADGPRSADPDLLGSRLARLIFGIAAPRPLANERLEAIRKFAVAAWYSNEVPRSRVEALLKAGVSTGQAWTMLAYVASRRQDVPGSPEPGGAVGPWEEAPHQPR